MKTKEVKMLWVTRHEPHVDRCASIWLIKNFIDKDAVFKFISRDSEIPKDAIAFTLPKAELKPTEDQTTFDMLVQRYKVDDQIVFQIGQIIRDFEKDADEDIDKVKLKESVGVYLILRGLARTSKSDYEIIYKAMIVMDALYAQLVARRRGEVE
jgi:hypothetical protein